MKKLIIILISLAVLLGFGYNCNRQKNVKSSQQVMKIGVIGPMSGNNAALGQNCRQGLEFAKNNLQDNVIDYQFIFEDDGFQPARAASAANKLINIDKVDALITCSAVSGSAATPIAAAKHKFILTVIASEAKIASQSPYSFLHWPSPSKEAEKLLELFAKKKAQKIIFFVENHPGAKALGDAAIAAAKASGRETIVYNFMSTERNFTDIVLKADAQNADMWVLLTLQPGINIIGKRIAELGIKTPYTTEEIPTFMEDKSMFENIEFVDVYDGEPEIIQQYIEKYQTNNLYGVAFAYDSLMIINQLSGDFYEREKRLPDSNELASALQNMTGYSGAVGPVIVDKDGVLQTQAVIKKVEKGKIVPLEKQF